MAGAEAGDSRADLQSAQQSWRSESVPASEWQVLAAEDVGDSEQNILSIAVFHSLLQPVVSAR